MFDKGDIVFLGELDVSGRPLLRDPEGFDVAIVTVEIILPAGDYDPEEVSYDQSDVFTMREDDDRCRVVILEGTHVVYEAEPRGVEFSVDYEDRDGDV